MFRISTPTETVVNLQAYLLAVSKFLFKGTLVGRVRTVCLGMYIYIYRYEENLTPSAFSLIHKHAIEGGGAMYSLLDLCA